MRALLGRCARHGHDDMRGTGADVRQGQVGQAAQHRDAADALALLGRVVVEQGQHGPAIAHVDAGHQSTCRFTGTEHDGAARLALQAVGACAGVLPHHAIDHARDRQHGNAEQRVQQQHRARHTRQLRHQHCHGAEHAGQQTGHGDALQVVETEEAPDTAVRAGEGQA